MSITSAGLRGGASTLSLPKSQAPKHALSTKKQAIMTSVSAHGDGKASTAKMTSRVFLSQHRPMVASGAGGDDRRPVDAKDLNAKADSSVYLPKDDKALQRLIKRQQILAHAGGNPPAGAEKVDAQNPLTGGRMTVFARDGAIVDGNGEPTGFVLAGASRTIWPEALKAGMYAPYGGGGSAGNQPSQEDDYIAQLQAMLEAESSEDEGSNAASQQAPAIPPGHAAPAWMQQAPAIPPGHAAPAWMQAEMSPPMAHVPATSGAGGGMMPAQRFAQGETQQPAPQEDPSTSLPQAKRRIAHRRISPEVRKEVLKALENPQGRSRREIAREFKVSPQWVHDFAHNPEGTGRKRGERVDTEVRKKVLEALKKPQGRSQSEIAREFKVSLAWINRLAQSLKEKGGGSGQSADPT